MHPPMRLGVALAAALLASSAFAAERRVIEAEEFDGLVRYPYHRPDVAGWYARESNCRSYGAPGKGYHAEIVEAAAQRTASCALATPLPPGKYKVFARVIGHAWNDRPNIIQVEFGGVVAAVEWSDLTKFTWKGVAVVETREPARAVTLRAVQFGGKGLRHLYDVSERTLAVDTIYVTSDLAEETGPTAEGGAMLELGRDAPVEVLAGKTKTERRNPLHAETPAPPATPRVASVRLVAVDGGRNLWPNSSFEIGGGDGWAGRNTPSYLHVFDEGDHVEGNAFHGRYCRRVPGQSQAMSRLARLPKPGPHTLSLYVRSAGDKVPVSVRLLRVTPTGKSSRHDVDFKKPLLAISAEAGPEWARASGTADLPETDVVLQVAADRDCLVDAVQLEAGPQATAYAPRAAVEVGLATTATANILYDDRPTTLVAWATNHGPAEAVARLRYDVVDVRERPVASGVVEVPVPVGATVRKDVVVSPVTRGIFSALYGVHDGAFPEGELGYCVLPKPPQAMPRHALASNMDNLDAAYALMAAMGHKWQLYCKLRAEWPNNLNPSPDRWNMDEARRVIAGPAKHGMKTMPCLWPTRVPKHLEDAARSPVDALADGRRDVTRAGRGGKIPPYPDVAKWSAYCRSVAEALADVAPWWTLEDETEGHYTPREFAPIVRATAEGFAASGKPVSLSLSCTPDYTEELIAELGDRPAFQGIGGSSYNMEYWDAAKIRGLQKRLKMDWHCIGVGQDSQPQMKHSFPGYASVYASAARTAREMVLLCLAQDAKVLGHYTGRLSAREGLYNVDFPLMDYDGAPLPHGFSYSCIPLLLANAEPVEDVYVEALDLLIFAYRQDGRLGAVTWAGNTPNLDIHWKVWPRDLRRFAIAGDVDVRDMYGNRRDDARLQDGRTVFDLGEEPVFVLNKGMADAAFLDSLRRATSAPPEVETRLAFLPDGKGGMDLGVWARNHTGRPLVGLKLDANFPDQRMVTLTGWLFPDRTGVMPDLAPGAAAFGRIPTAHRPAFPVENATITVWLTADGREHPWYERCWMMPAPRLAVNVDGRIDEWSRVQPAWLWNSFSWGRYGRSFPQIVAGAENIKHVYRLDGRAAVWTAWDDTRLYVAFRCEDDVFVFTGPRERRDHFALRFDCDLMGDFGPQASTPDVEVAVLPTGDGVQVSGCEGARAAMSVEGRAWTVEVALPIRAVMARAPAAGEALGFDLVWTDADPEGGEVAVSRMRWAGGSRTLGQVFLTQ